MFGTRNALERIERRIEALEKRQHTDFLWMLGVMLTGFSVMFGVMAHGFKWF